MNFIRYPFFCVNLIFMIFGILAMSLGILLLTNYSMVEQILRTNVDKSTNSTEVFYRSEASVLLQPSPAPRWLARIRDPASYLLIAFGGAYFTLSFIGYCGSVKDSRGLMVIYALLLGIIVIHQIVGVAMYVKYKPDLREEMKNAVSNQYKSEEMLTFTKFEFIMDLLMINYKCCGVNSEKDFLGTYAHLYRVRSIDPRSGSNVKSVTLRPDSSGVVVRDSVGLSEMEPSKETVQVDEEGNDAQSRVVTDEKARQVPVACCKMNITTMEAVKLLRNIYRKQEDKLKLLEHVIDDACIIAPDETNAYVGDSHGCFDKIQGEISTTLRIGLIVVGLIQLCGLVFALFIFKTAYYDWLG